MSAVTLVKPTVAALVSISRATLQTVAPVALLVPVAKSALRVNAVELVKPTALVPVWIPRQTTATVVLAEQLVLVVRPVRVVAVLPQAVAQLSLVV